MNHKAIEKWWTARQKALADDAAAFVDLRLRSIVRCLREYRVVKIVFGNGTYFVKMRPFVLKTEDGELLEEEEFDVLMACVDGRSLCEPLRLPTDDRRILLELRALCDWCIDNDIALSDINLH